VKLSGLWGVQVAPGLARHKHYMGEAMAKTDDAISGADTFERAKLISRTHLWELVIIGVTIALCVASLGIPLYVVYLMVNALAGKSTAVSAVISYTSAGIVGATAGSAVLTGGVAKYRSQRAELIRLRTRCTELESRLKEKKRRQ
jgi:hypothetical protein